MKLRIGVIFGGKSCEHDVSIISGLQAAQALNKDSYDVTVDAFGAYPHEITFAYARHIVTAEVTVHYLTEFNQPLTEDQILTLNEGVNTVTAPEFPGYTLISPGSFSVSVDGSGAYPSEITFAYTLPLAKDDPFYTVAGIQANVPHFYEKNVSQMELGDSDITLGSFDKK